MEDKLLEEKYDEYYEGENLITIKYETYQKKDGSTYVVKKKRVEGYKKYCGCSGDTRDELTILEPFKIIE